MQNIQASGKKNKTKKQGKTKYFNRFLVGVGKKLIWPLHERNHV